jgi:hypothetical protein
MDSIQKNIAKKHGLSARQPLCAKVLSEMRSQSGKERGIPVNLRKAIDARTKKKGSSHETVRKNSLTNLKA